MQTPFPINPALSSIAVAYKNTALIADEVLPYVQVGAQTFKYYTYTKAEPFTIPDTKVGRKSKVNEVDFTMSETEASCMDYGLDDKVPQSDIDNAPDGYNPMGIATEGIMSLVKLDREKRAADLVFGAANYAAANKATLSGSDQWSHADSVPITKILAALDACLMRPNIMVIGQAAWSILRAHADIVSAVQANAGVSGLVSRQAVADLFELDELLVGQGWYNSAKKGQTATFTRMWGKLCALLHRNKTATNVNGMTTFGYTARFGSPVAMSAFDKDIGLRGGQVVRSGESVKELMIADDLGYLFSAAVA